MKSPTGVRPGPGRILAAKNRDIESRTRCDGRRSCCRGGDHKVADRIHVGFRRPFLCLQFRNLLLVLRHKLVIGILEALRFRFLLLELGLLCRVFLLQTLFLAHRELQLGLHFVQAADLRLVILGDPLNAGNPPKHVIQVTGTHHQIHQHVGPHIALFVPHARLDLCIPGIDLRLFLHDLFLQGLDIGFDLGNHGLLLADLVRELLCQGLLFLSQGCDFVRLALQAANGVGKIRNGLLQLLPPLVFMFPEPFAGLHALGRGLGFCTLAVPVLCIRIVFCIHRHHDRRQTARCSQGRGYEKTRKFFFQFHRYHLRYLRTASQDPRAPVSRPMPKTPAVTNAAKGQGEIRTNMSDSSTPPRRL